MKDYFSQKILLIVNIAIVNLLIPFYIKAIIRKPNGEKFSIFTFCFCQTTKC